MLVGWSVGSSPQVRASAGDVVITRALVAHSRVEYISAAKLIKVIGLSAGLASDAAFARQLRLRFLSSSGRDL